MPDNLRRSAILHLLATCVHAGYNEHLLSKEQLRGTPDAQNRDPVDDCLFWPDLGREGGDEGRKNEHSEVIRWPSGQGARRPSRFA
jgi:hypothetical protein